MQVLRATELFNNMENIDSIEFENAWNINIDFSNVYSIDLKAINVLLNMKKVAILNNKTLSVTNVSPKIRQMFDVTGLDKTFSSNKMTNPIIEA